MLRSLRLLLQRYVTGYRPVPRFVSRVKKRHRIAHTDPVAGMLVSGFFSGKAMPSSRTCRARTSEAKGELPRRPSGTPVDDGEHQVR